MSLVWDIWDGVMFGLEYLFWTEILPLTNNPHITYIKTTITTKSTTTKTNIESKTKHF